MCFRSPPLSRHRRTILLRMERYTSNPVPAVSSNARADLSPSHQSVATVFFNSIRVLKIADDWSEAVVRLRLRPWNRNYVRTHFGGNLFAMTDPIWMLLAMRQLGEAYYVWAKAGEIDFIAPGREDVYAHFVLPAATTDELRVAAAAGGKALRWFPVDIRTANGELVARVRKQLYVKLKPRARQSA